MLKIFNRNKFIVNYNVNCLFFSTKASGIEKGFDKKPKQSQIKADYIGKSKLYN